METSSGRAQSKESMSSSAHNLGEQQWHALGDVQYRKWQVFAMGWDQMRLENFRVCGAPFGGPVALIREDKDKAAEKAASLLSIYSSSGVLISQCDWQPKAIAGMGWSDQEQLVVVLEEGTVLTYDTKAKLTRSFSLLDSASLAASSSSSSSHAVHLLECHFWGNGLVAMAADMQAYVAEGLASPDPTSLPRRYKLRTSLTPDRPYTSMAIIPPLLSRSGLLELFLGTVDNSVLVADENDVEDQLLQVRCRGSNYQLLTCLNRNIPPSPPPLPPPNCSQDRIAAPITKMVVQPNGRYLACYRRDGVLTVMSSTFTTKVLDFDTKSISRPLDIAWCGEDSVVLLWRNTGVVMVGPFGDWLNFPYSEGVHLVAESDCVRIITPTTCDMIQRVPPHTEAIRRIGSTDPAALMFDAMEAFEEGDPKSDENIRSIAASSREALNDAVSACIAAAASEFDVAKQQSYLKAAAYGKAFSSDIDPREFCDTALKLRVLNEVRRPAVGIPLTIQQYNRLTPEVLISRLTCRDMHLLALRVCALLQLKPERVLVHWASEKVKRLAPTPASDEEIADTIRRRLQSFPRVSFLEVAAAAYQMGRRRLATIVLDMETHAADQVPLLLSMQEDELALQKSINSEDTDLIYLVLIHLERSRPDIENFYRLVHAHPEASNLLKMYYKCKVQAGDRTLLHKLLMHNKQYLEAGISAVSQVSNLQPPFPFSLSALDSLSAPLPLYPPPHRPTCPAQATRPSCSTCERPRRSLTRAETSHSSRARRTSRWGPVLSPSLLILPPSLPPHPPSLPSLPSFHPCFRLLVIYELTSTLLPPLKD